MRKSQLSGNRLRRITLISTVACVASSCVQQASADVNIQTVPVRDVGNAPDSSTGFGQVNYAYNIGKYDVTSSQYCAFLNAVAATDTYGTYHPNMAGTSNGNPGIVQSGSQGDYTYSVAAGRDNYPVTDVSFWNATRFANWLDNGQPNGPEGAGTTETGTYNLLSTSMDAVLASTPNQKYLVTTDSQDNNSVARNPDASWAITNENEWYKAAYYSTTKNNGTPGYYLGPAGSDATNATQFNTGGTDTTPVGSYPYPSPYGTYDQGGDVYQWNETITNGYNVRGARGGSFDDGGDWGRAFSSESTYQQPYITDDAWGFRVVQLSVPDVPQPGVLTWNNSGGTGDGSTWDVNTNQNWNNGSSAAVYVDGSSVTFNDSNAGNYRVALNSTVAPSSVAVNASGNYTITGTGSIAGNSVLTKSGTGGLFLNVKNTYTGGTVVNGGNLVEGVAGALPQESSLNISGAGIVTLAPGLGTQTFSSLTLAPTATLDITNNRVLIADTPGEAASVLSALQQGQMSNPARASGGIISSTAAANQAYGVAFGEGSVISSIPSGEIQLSYCLLGDINQDGVVNGADFSILAANLNRSTTGGWEQGDFNYGGQVTGVDFAELAGNFGRTASGGAVQLPSSSWVALDAFAATHNFLTDLPEPGSLSFIAVGAYALSKRRRA